MVVVRHALWKADGRVRVHLRYVVVQGDRCDLSKKGAGTFSEASWLEIGSEGREEMKLNQIGFWSEIKLEIIKKYAAAYTSIMSKQE
jgi:hypothetical protein